MKQVEEKYGHLNIVVNCAGIGVAFPLYNSNKWTLDKFHLANDLLEVGTMKLFYIDTKASIK